MDEGRRRAVGRTAQPEEGKQRSRFVAVSLERRSQMLTGGRCHLSEKKLVLDCML